MPGIFLRHAFAFEHVAEVAAAIRADDFGAFHAEGVVFLADNGAGDFIIERRPAAAAVELVGRAVKLGVAAAADVGAGGFVVPVFTGESAFGAFLGDHVFFIGGEGVPLIGRRFHVGETRYGAESFCVRGVCFAQIFADF